MRERSRGEELKQLPISFRSPCVRKRGRQRSDRCLLQSHQLAGTEEGFDGTPKAGPEFNLPGDRPFGMLAGESCVEDKGIGKLDRLAHALKVAKCYSTGQG